MDDAALRALCWRPSPWRRFFLPIGGAGIIPRWSAAWPRSWSSITVAGLHAPVRVWHTAHEYISFITLIGSLFVVSGGIHINVKGRGDAARSTSVSVFRRVAGQCARHHGRLHAAHPALVADEQIPRQRPSRGVFHFHRLQRRRLPDAGGRSAAVPGLFDGRAVLVGGGAGLPHLAGWASGFCSCSFFCVDYRNYLRAPRQVRAEQTGHAEEWRFDGVENLFFLGGRAGRRLCQPPALFARGADVGAAAGFLFHDPQAGA